ncbi:hypothetical protein COLO4_30352 [Corchorus olitorius]|uniref:Thionin-like protein 2 n=1 Tax=Corchorus olitorius TaxID=93759 RepID=A0A1R3H8X0_9ROSI|nr:hypothetical protein COLO4_30352 [Corchorus olitorius]
MVVSLMVLMMVVLAQGQAELGFKNPSADTGLCATSCGARCLPRLYAPQIAFCFGLCMIGCKLRPSEAVFKCTSGCANSMVNSYKPTAAERVENIVGSCYQTCKQNSIN